jgi:CheY-like chemotaxis protein
MKNLVYHFVGMGNLPSLRYKHNSDPSRERLRSVRASMYGETGTDVSSQLNIEQQAATVSWMKALGPKTVLCVDDEKIGLRVRKILLESHGFKVLTASSGQQGLALLDDHHVDLVILDYYMPDLNGGQVASEIRRRRPGLPIIFLSAYFSLPAADLELANAFITKGDPPDVLVDKIKQLT